MSLSKQKRLQIMWDAEVEGLSFPAAVLCPKCNVTAGVCMCAYVRFCERTTDEDVRNFFGDPKK